MSYLNYFEITIDNSSSFYIVLLIIFRGIILIVGSFKTSLFAILRSKDNNSEGNNSKLESIAKIRL